MLEVQEERAGAAAATVGTGTASGTAPGATARKERAKDRQEEGQDCSGPAAATNAGSRSARAKAAPAAHSHTHTHSHTPSPHQHTTASASVALGLSSMHSSNPKVRNSPSANTQRWDAKKGPRVKRVTLYNKIVFYWNILRYSILLCCSHSLAQGVTHFGLAKSGGFPEIYDAKGKLSLPTQFLLLFKRRLS